MTEYNSQINYEKHFIVNNLSLPHEMCDIIKDYLFYNIETSKKINLMRFSKMQIFRYFEENLRFYESVACHMCGNFQLVRNRDGVLREKEIHKSIRCECGEYSMWLPLMT
jgi:hypothetical protein